MVLCRDYQFSTRRACGLIGFSRSSNEYRGRPDRHARIRERLVTLSGKHRRYGYRMLHAKLGQEGFKVNVKVVERLYREERLTLRRRNRKKIPKGVREGAWCPIAANQRWSLDFTMDALANGRKFRTVNLKDDCTRECPAIDVALSIPGSRVVEMLERVARERGYPDVLTVDNGPELRGRALDGWADDHGVQLYFIDPGKPTQNAYIESFNGRFREECLNLNWFTSLAEAERIIEDWRIDYNQNRPHSSLNYQTPEEFAANRPFHKPQWAATLELSERLRATAHCSRRRIMARASPLCFRSHQMLIGLLRSRHGSWTVPGDVRELLDLEKLVSSAVRQAGGPALGPD